jgi:hypothetical protein
MHSHQWPVGGRIASTFASPTNAQQSLNPWRAHSHYLGLFDLGEVPSQVIEWLLDIAKTHRFPSELAALNVQLKTFITVHCKTFNTVHFKTFITVHCALNLREETITGEESATLRLERGRAILSRRQTAV